MNTVAIVGTGPDRRFVRPGPAKGRVRRRDSGRQLAAAAMAEAARSRAPSTGRAARPRPCRRPTWCSSRRPSAAFWIRASSGSAGAARARWSPTRAAPSARSSTRRGRRITRCQFLGGHPMAGKEKRGAAAARCGPVPRPHLGADARRAGGARNARGARVPRLAGTHRRARRGAGCGRARPRGVAHLAPAAAGLHRAGRGARQSNWRRRERARRAGADRHDTRWR